MSGHIFDGNGMAFGSVNIWNFNHSYTHEQVREELRAYLGIDSLIVVEPIQGDMTRHIAMFCKLLNDTLCLVGAYAEPSQGYPGDDEILNDPADQLAALHNLDGRPFSVARIPMLPYAASVNRTYRNALILNDKVLVPTNDVPTDTIGVPTDTIAMGIYADWMPRDEIIGNDARQIICHAGAVYCVAIRP